ncbi:MAG TPA: adenylate/guanylate cyclase domain-containing protein, partial [Bradyrhizobium sp.]|nr:adenylate/guanylate cyclase domain-containing protein [Bradyrhizobium sp.]
GVEMLTISPDRKLRADQYDYAGIDIKPKGSTVEDGKYLVTEQPWFRDAIAARDQQWSTLTTLPRGERLAAMLAVPIDVDGERT